MNKNKLKDLKGEIYTKQLNESEIDLNPFAQFIKWMDDVINANIQHANAMVLSTVNSKGIPSSRTVLLKGLDKKGFIFFTNYLSEKAKDLKENPNASLLFFWKEFERQVRINGKVKKITKKESQKYFKTRPTESKLGTWASKQSETIPNREYLSDKYLKAKELFKNKDIPMPSYWGGYVLLPSTFEFWQGREMRLHDRIKYEKKKKDWKFVRLSP
ncbi:MAG: pyridoxamine 5'-phosphate oxidase [Ignavibacteriales bacterium CG_4_9_14_3_um_filter_30_11]|nr:MAG: pyridoxamine 5'-phosphate oxidase [Ignavibacteriales bacterium CG_4_9_14_3_um_filter_30_11]